MKKKELIAILDQRKKECESYRKKCEKQLRYLRSQKELGFDREILGGIQHPIGYFTGVIDEINNIKRLLSLSLAEYEREKRQIEDYNKKQKKYLKSLLNEEMKKRTRKSNK
jgi:hypothetical protein